MTAKPGPFTGRGRRYSGKQVGAKTPDRTPGGYWARITKGVAPFKSKQGHGDYAGVELVVVKHEHYYTAEENAPHGQSLAVGLAIGWIFNLHIGKTWEEIADGNLNNIAESVMETVGFAELLSEEEAEKLDGLIEASEGGDQDADPSGYVLDLLTADGGEKFAGLPIYVRAFNCPNKGNRKYCACELSPVTAEELAEHYSTSESAAAK